MICLPLIEHVNLGVQKRLVETEILVLHASRLVG
jgi:hypothetical protein